MNTFPVLYLHTKILFCFPSKCNFIILWLKSLIFSHYSNWQTFSLVKQQHMFQNHQKSTANIVPSSRIRIECWKRYDNWLFMGYWHLFMKKIFIAKRVHISDDFLKIFPYVAVPTVWKCKADTTVTGLIYLELVSLAVVYAEWDNSNQLC